MLFRSEGVSVNKLAAVVVAVGFLAGCGTSESDVYDAVQDQAVASGLTDAEASNVADCATPQVVKELSEEQLDQLVEDTTITDTKASAVVTKILGDCLVSALK